MLVPRFRPSIKIWFGIAVAVVLLVASPANRFTSASAQTFATQLQISTTGPDGDPTFDAYSPAIAFNSTDNEYLVIWTAYIAPMQAVGSNYGQRIDAATGAKVGVPGFYISDNRSYQQSPGDHCTPSVAYSPVANEYLVVSRQSEPSNFYQAAEVYGQRLAHDGSLLGAPSRLSAMTEPTDPYMAAFCAAVVFNSVANEYLVAFAGVTGRWPKDHTRYCGLELYFQRVSPAGVPIGERAEYPLGCTFTSYTQPKGELAIAHNAASNDYLLAWTRSDSSVWLLPLTGAGIPVGSVTIAGTGCARPSVAAGGTGSEYLVVWNGCDGLYARRIVGGTPDVIVTVAEPGTSGPPSVIYDTEAEQYLVAWTGAPGTTPEAGEVHARPLAAHGSPIGSAIQISRMGALGDQTYGAFLPAVARGRGARNYFVAWSGDDNSGGHVDEEFEIYGRAYSLLQEYIVGLTAFRDQGGWIARHADAPSGWLRVPWSGYNALGGGTHPAMGDLDGDGLNEIVVGLDAEGQNWLAILSDGPAVDWVHLAWPAFDTPTYPAVGNLDADSRAEIVIGLGAGTAGWILILDDASANFAPLGWRQVQWPMYTVADGRTHPAIGDVNGDGVAEIIVGLGPGSLGWVEVFNGAAAGFSHRGWFQVPWPGYNAANGTTWPAAGDVDGDGSDEIVVGLGAGSSGWLAAFAYEAAGFKLLRWLQLDWQAYNDATGETHPAIGNVDGDAALEIIAGLAQWSGVGGWYEIFDDLNSGVGSAGLAWRQVPWNAYTVEGGGTYPASARPPAR